ncbi:DUF1761 domain-containing protein [Qipengyuania sp. YIM B01966]|uniref:DUF1761 domain-containing protein n=1 Tax=Qipengyuania sp. YIM B01966 TaxID=2778646 RepID=UPI0018F375F6|nr:DUF1761 domain-containing protein [Qipengyuania sp. YIM B01966]
MGLVDWSAVMVAALSAFALGGVWYGPLFGEAKREYAPRIAEARRNKVVTLGTTLLLMLVSATMLGHFFARIGPVVLAQKPWLYAMQSGGVALAFVVPALWTSYIHQRRPLRLALMDGGYWIASYLAMGAVFWALS